MAVTLSFGFIDPQNGDVGSVWFPALNSNIEQLNSHDHDGLNSSKLTSQSVTPISASISHLNWVLTSGGRYHQTVTTPASITFDSYGMAFRTSGGIEIHPTITKLTPTTYTVSVIDNTLDLTVIYLV